MTKKLLFTLAVACLLAFQKSHGQNLVLNPGFESVNLGSLNCSWYISEAQFVAAIDYWDYPTTGSTDIFHMSLDTDCYSHPFSTSSESPGYQLPHTGDSMAAVVTMGPGGCTPYREYVQGELSQALTPGVTYNISFYVSLADYMNRATNNIGILFTTQRYDLQHMCVWETVPHANYDGPPIIEKDNWILLNLTYTATEPNMKYFSIGNFYTDNQTTWVPVSGSKSTIRYFIDDVSISPADCDLVANAGADQSISCNATTTLSGSASGGTGPYTYSWSPATGLDNPNTANPTASPLETTTYTLTVTDAESCSSTSSVTLSVPGAPAPPEVPGPLSFCSLATATVGSLTAIGTNIQWYTSESGGAVLPDETVLVSGTYYASQTVTGCESARVPVEITITPAAVPQFNQVASMCAGTTANALPPISVDGISGTWSPPLNNMQTTTYSFTPADGECATPATMTIEVEQPATPLFAQVDPVCFNTGFALPAVSTNGIAGSWSPEPDLTQSATYTFTPAPGECASTASMNVTILSPTAISIDGACINFDFIVRALPVADEDLSGYEFQWYVNGSQASQEHEFNLTAYLDDLPGATLPLTVSVDATDPDGCVTTAEQQISNIACRIQKGVSANGDGVNDNFDLTQFEVNKLTIFNRYGMEVYSKNNYADEWTGKSNEGEMLPDAVYYYMIEFANSAPKTGWIYLSRKQ